MFKKTVFLLLICSVLCLFSCTDNAQEHQNSQIVATLFPQYDFARQIVKDKYTVSMLLDPGVESHTFDPSGSDMQTIYSCDLLLYTGDNMEPWASTLINNDNCKNKIVDVSKGINLGSFDQREHSHEHDNLHSLDPHIWTSPKNAKIMVNNILESLCEKYPDDKDFFVAGANELISLLDKLDSDITSIVANSKRQTLYFGGRNAFYYLLRDYNLKSVSAYDSCSEGSEPTLKKLAQMSKEITENNIPVILCEELGNNKVSKTLGESTGAKTALFHSCHNLSKRDFEAGKTYIDIMTQNLKVLQEALN